MDTKAAGVVGVCVIIAALIISLGPRGRATPAEPEAGRYQFVRSNGVNCFVLDTKTGRLWQGFVSSSSNESTTWSENKAPWVAEPAGK